VLHSVIVPAYNEEQGLPVVLENLNSLLDETYEVIVVDDGSSDGTRKAAQAGHCRVISHAVNRGKGAAMRTGIRHARGKNVIFIDADGTYPVSAIPVIAEKLKTHEMVVARRMTGSNIHPFNRLGNWMFGFMMKFLYKSVVVDPLSGLYGIHTDFLKRMSLRSQGFEIETEFTIKAAQMHLKVGQIEISYDPRIGQTKLRPLQDGLRILKTIVLLLFLYNPTAVFTVPGLTLFLLSTVLVISLMAGPLPIGRIFLSYHTHIFASMMGLVGLQIAVFGTAAKMYAVLHKYAKPDRVTRVLTNRSFIYAIAGLGILSVLVALIIGIQIFVLWLQSGFEPLYELKKAIFLFFLLSFGVQVLFSIVFLSIFFGELRRVEGERDELTLLEPAD
jgi:glycosyltransferase involved in cell wall biosynthesis